MPPSGCPMARDPRRNAHLSHALYARFVAGDGDGPVAARRCGIAMATLYDLCENRRDLPARLIPGLALGDAEFFATLSGARDAGLTVSAAAKPDVAPEGMRGAALLVGADSGRVLSAVAEAEADGVVIDVELERIEAEIDRAERRLEELRAAARVRRTRAAGDRR